MEILEAIKTRRSIRKYKTDPVDDSTLETILEAARWAPSWANTQCWRFIVVRDSDMKSKLTETLSETNPARDAVRNAPLVIVACAELGSAGYKGGTTVTDKGDITPNITPINRQSYANKNQYAKGISHQRIAQIEITLHKVPEVVADKIQKRADEQYEKAGKKEEVDYSGIKLPGLKVPD